MSEVERPLLVTSPPKKPKPLPQKSGPGDVQPVRGEDADIHTPMRWSGAGRCGHRVIARVGPRLTASWIDPSAPPSLSLEFVTVYAEPGECPECDDAQRMPVRDA